MRRGHGQHGGGRVSTCLPNKTRVPEGRTWTKAAPIAGVGESLKSQYLGDWGQGLLPTTKMFLKPRKPEVDSCCIG